MRILYLISVCIFVMLFLHELPVTGQIKNIGIPFIENYTREEYQAGSQNWSIAQDKDGVIYIGNNSGLLTFNGSEWHTYPISNGSIVRSVACIDNRIYVGGFNEFGYFSKNAFGDIEYTSLSDQLPERDKNFDEIWRIFQTNGGIIFQSYSDIFIYKNQQFKVLEPKSRFGFSSLIDSTIYIVDREYGLYVVEDGRLRPVYLDDKFFIENEILVIFKQGRLYLCTTNKGLFYYNGKQLVPWDVPVNKLFIQNQIYSGLPLNNNQIAIGTIQDGLYVIDNKGNIDLHLNRTRGIQNNTILSLFYDNYKNLWLGLDNGIDMLETNSPITLLNYSSNIETSYAAIVYKGTLYIGTNQGLFAKPYVQISNEYLDKQGFQKIDGTLGQVWRLKIIDGKLFCGHNFGSFIIDGDKAAKISGIPGGWDFIEVPWNKDYIIGGAYTGLTLYKKTASYPGWKEICKIEGIQESCKDLYFDDNKNLWINHGLKGAFRVVLSGDLKSAKQFTIYSSKDGLPEIPYNFTRIKQRLLLLANDTLFEYNAGKDKFIADKEPASLFGGIKGLTRIIEDQNGDLWYFTKSNMGALRLLEDGTYIKITKPFSRVNNLFIRQSFENIYTTPNNNTFIGSQEGIIHYVSDYQKDFEEKYNVYLGEVKTRSRKIDENEASKDEMLEKKLPLKDEDIEVPFKYSSITFKFYTPYFEANDGIKFAYRLKGFDNNWSEWGKNTFKEYTNLSEGNYTFEVKAINIYNNESVINSYSFEVEPPFYRSKLAYALYTILILALAIINLVYFNRKIEKTRQIEKQKLKLKEKEFQKEAQKSEEKIERLQEEKLQSEMRLKNIELANSTMHLIQKNKLLNNIKKELTSVAERAKLNSVKQDIKSLVTKIDKDINHDQNFKLFDKYFERVHQDFVKRMKEKHPNLTPKDLRLCAYLRMNLETKEIAPLLNVSIRGLEISRYRLRKKLDIDHKENLVDYIMNI